MLHRRFPAIPPPSRSARQVDRATCPPANPPIDGAALRRSLNALERVLGR